MENINLEAYQDIFPKHVQINTYDFNSISKILNIKDLINPSLLSFNNICVTATSQTLM